MIFRPAGRKSARSATSPERCECLASAHKAAAIERARDLEPILQELAGMSARKIAAELTRRGAVGAGTHRP